VCVVLWFGMLIKLRKHMYSQTHILKLFDKLYRFIETPECAREKKILRYI
jgi:hypothetical protein